MRFIGTTGEEYIAVDTIARIFQVVYPEDEDSDENVEFWIETKRGEQHSCSLGQDLFESLIYGR